LLCAHPKGMQGVLSGGPQLHDAEIARRSSGEVTAVGLVSRREAEGALLIEMGGVVPDIREPATPPQDVAEDLSRTRIPYSATRSGRLTKRLLDIAGATVGLVVLAPVLLATGALIAAVDGRPVLFTQLRAGLHGRPFRVVKFRTMARDADGQRDSLRARNEIAGGASFKLDRDPRVTRLGRTLRKASIDELPQLLNVVRGEMSLVGPRPHPFDDVAGYAAWHHRRLEMPPGMTGLWQISARSSPDFDEWVRLDLDYIERWSIWLDLRILLLTLPAVLRAEGR
jgi:lipopolysaccharide/colanic/teichoic acid biosynthesis glycosyltransferase